MQSSIPKLGELQSNFPPNPIAWYCGLLTMELATWSIEDDGRVLAEIQQYPLRLAWAITVHKSQGMSLDCAEIDLSKAFTEGMGYVALSRVRSLSGIKLIGLNEMALKVNPMITELDKELKRMSDDARKDLKSLLGSKKPMY